MSGLVDFASAGVIALAQLGGAVAASGAGGDPVQIAAARTVADHNAIAAAYEKQAAELELNAELNQRMADAYKQGGKPTLSSEAKHCAALVNELWLAARESRVLASEHRGMAVNAAK